MENSIKLFRHSLICYSPVELGAPTLFPAAPLGGDLHLLDRVAQILEGPNHRANKNPEYYAESYLQFLQDFPRLVAECKLEVGSYEVPDLNAFLDSFSPESEEVFQREILKNSAEGFQATKKSFQVEDTHLKMLDLAKFSLELEYRPIYLEESDHDERRELVSLLVERYTNLVQEPERALYMELVSAVDCKRPYGDRGYFFWDLEDASVPGVEADGEIDSSNNRRLFSDDEEERILGLHRATTLALQALVLYGKHSV